MIVLQLTVELFIHPALAVLFVTLALSKFVLFTNEPVTFERSVLEFSNTLRLTTVMLSEEFNKEQFSRYDPFTTLLMTLQFTTVLPSTALGSITEKLIFEFFSVLFSIKLELIALPAIVLFLIDEFSV